jgi:hypothetical protein
LPALSHAARARNTRPTTCRSRQGRIEPAWRPLSGGGGLAAIDRPPRGPGGPSQLRLVRQSVLAAVVAVAVEEEPRGWHRDRHRRAGSSSRRRGRRAVRQLPAARVSVMAVPEQQNGEHANSQGGACE